MSDEKKQKLREYQNKDIKKENSLGIIMNKTVFLIMI